MAKPKDLELLHAAKANDTGAVRKLLAKIKAARSKKGNKLKYNINLQDEDGFTSLHHAALKGNTEIALSLFDMDCTVNAKDNKGMSPLHLAAWAGQVEVARLMVEKGAEVNMRSSTGETPLHLACQHGNIEVAEVLMDANADPAILNRNGSAGIDLASQYGRSQIVQFLLQSEAVINLLNLSDSPRNSDPPLHLAAKTGHTEIVRMLIEAGAPINQMGKNGTCLHEAALYGKTEVVKLLLDMKIDVDARNSEGHTALDVVHLFTSSKASIEIKLLLKGASESKTVFARATTDYCNIYDPTCLSFKAGDTIMVLEQNESGRWKGKIHDGQKERIGYFPSTAVKVSGKKKGRATSLKDCGIVPRGTYDMVTLSAAGAAPPPQPQRKDSPPVSSFGPNKKIPAALLPIQDKAELLNKIGNLHKTPPSKKALGESKSSPLKQNGTTFKPQSTLNYTQVVVEKNSNSPPPQQGQSFKTPYAEVVLPASPTETEVEAGVPSLPPKESRHEISSPNGDVWVKNKEVLPLLPPKKGKEKAKTDFSPTDEAPPSFKPPPVPIKMENTKLKIGKKAESTFDNEKAATNMNVDSNQPVSPESLEAPPTFKPPPVPVKMDQVKLTVEEPVKPPTPVGTPEQARKMKTKGYEDMSFTPEPPSAAGTSTKEAKSPQKNENYMKEGVNLRDSPKNRQKIATYENVELKKKPKAVKELSMLITELDKKDYGDGAEEYVLVNRSSTSSLGYEDVHARQAHSYENIPQPDSLSHTRHSASHGELGESKEYENMEILESPIKPSQRASQEYEQMDDGFRKRDKLEEPVSPRSAGYTPMRRASIPELPTPEYINVNEGLTSEVNTNIGPGTAQITQLKMREYNAMYDWLESFKLNIYIENFVKGGFDMISMKGLTAEDLTTISITKMGHRKKLLAESAKLPPLSDEFPKTKPADIMTWLKLIGLDQYIPNFLDGGFDDMAFVQDLTVEDLETIEINKPGHRRKLWLAAIALKEKDGGNDSGFETTKETSLTQDTSLNGKVKPFLQTDLDALTRQNENQTSQETNPEREKANPILTANDATKITNEVKIGLGTAGEVEENEPDLDSMLAEVGVENTESENKVASEAGEKGEESLEKKTVAKDDDKQGETVLLHPNSQEALADQMPPVFDNQMTITVSEPSMHVESSESQTSSHVPTVTVQSKAQVLTDGAEAQIPSKPAPPPVRPKPRSSSGSREHLDQISHSAEIAKNKPVSPPVKPKPKPQSVKEISGKFVSNSDSRSAPPVRPKSFKKPPHIPPKPVSPDPILRTSSFSCIAKHQDVDPVATRDRSSSERSARKTPPPPPPRRSSDKSMSSRSSSGSNSSVDLLLEEMEVRRRSLELISPGPHKKASSPVNLQPPDHTTAVNSGIEKEQIVEERGLDEQITDILRRRSRDDLTMPELQDSSFTTAEKDLNGNEDTFTMQSGDASPEGKVAAAPKDTLIEDISNMLSDFTSELDNMFN